jgi:hypothetical protein
LGASDLIVDGQGSTVNFSDLCLGLNLPNVARVMFKNFKFAWPRLQIATVATVTVIGGNATTGFSYDVAIDAEHAANLPTRLAGATAWNTSENHWDLVNVDDDVFYGDGYGSGQKLRCTETPEQRRTNGCHVKDIPSFGAQFKVGEAVLLRHYDFASAVSGWGQDITLDNIALENVIGVGFVFSQGRGFRVTRSSLSRMAGQPISGGGNALDFGQQVSGDVVIDNGSFGYNGDDGFDLSAEIVRFTPTKVSNSTPMVTYQFIASRPSEIQWPAFGGAPKEAHAGDTIALFDHALAFRKVATVASATLQASRDASTLILDHPIDPELAKGGFIAADLSIGAGARYVIRHNTFAYNNGRALRLHTPFGWIDHNRFVGQRLKEVVYVLASQYWGEGPGAQELIISNNVFDGAHHRPDYFALDLLQEAADFPNSEDEVTGTNRAMPGVNQNIVIAHNLFSNDRGGAIVNLSSMNNVVFSRSDFVLTDRPEENRMYELPISAHDATNIFFDHKNHFDPAWLSVASCAQSRLLSLLTPAPGVSVYTPAACGITATVSNMIFARRHDERGRELESDDER